MTAKQSTFKRLATPVVLLIFNRPQCTARIFAEIAKAKPATLLVVADGPRPDHPTDVERCAATRAIIEQVDWECDVSKNYAQSNLGLRRRVAGGLTWAFEQVAEAIILEDDCIPHPSFFRFCDEMLDRYRDDTRVMAIAGSNFQGGRQRTPYSYYFSRYPHCWGWASWRRAWRNYDDDMRLWPQVRGRNLLEDMLEERFAARQWTKIFESVYEERVNSWAYRWTLACWLQSGLTILPNVNLVTNVGYDEAATHTSSDSPSLDLPAHPMAFPLRHPPYLVRNRRADQFTQHHHFGSAPAKLIRGKLLTTLQQVRRSLRGL